MVNIIVVINKKNEKGILKKSLTKCKIEMIIIFIQTKQIKAINNLTNIKFIFY